MTAVKNRSEVLLSKLLVQISFESTIQKWSENISRHFWMQTHSKKFATISFVLYIEFCET